MTVLEPGEIQITPTATLNAIEANKPKLVAMELQRNYRPESDYEIVGYNQTEIKVKNTAGVMTVIRPAEFIPDVGMPPSAAGTGPEAGLNKILAGTVVRLPKDEAARLVKLGIGTRSLED